MLRAPAFRVPGGHRMTDREAAESRRLPTCEPQGRLPSTIEATETRLRQCSVMTPDLGSLERALMTRGERIAGDLSGLADYVRVGE
jgi:hypothetical protein